MCGIGRLNDLDREIVHEPVSPHLLGRCEFPQLCGEIGVDLYRGLPIALKTCLISP